MFPQKVSTIFIRTPYASLLNVIFFDKNLSSSERILSDHSNLHETDILPMAVVIKD